MDGIGQTCMLLARYFLNCFSRTACLFVLSLYTVGRLVTLPCEISFESPSLGIRVRWQSMVCTGSDNAFQRFVHLKFSKMAAGRHLGFDPTGNGAVRSAVPENPSIETYMKGSAEALQRQGHLKFLQKCVLALRSVVGRSLIFMLLTLISYTPLLLRWERRTRGVLTIAEHILSSSLFHYSHIVTNA